MISQDFMHSGLFNWVVLPLLIFLSRMTDVTLGTLRHIFISKGFKKIVPFLGFFEVLIWLIVIAQIMKNLNNVACYLGWAAGFSAGTFIGMKLDEKMALGMQVLRIITHQPCEELVSKLNQENLGVTVIDGKGSKGPVKVILTVVKRKDIPLVATIINNYLPDSFYSLEDIKATNKGVFPVGGSSLFSTDWFLKRK